MKRVHVSALVIGLLAGILVGGLAVVVTMSRMERQIAPVAPVPPITPKSPIPETKPRQRRLARAARTSTVKPTQKLNAKVTWRPLYPPVAPVGDGTIFSGADPKDPRIYHFAE